MGHRLSWLRIIDELSPIRDFTEQVRRDMAEFLSLAAPQGPVGITHESDCDCPGAEQIVRIHGHVDGEKIDVRFDEMLFPLDLTNPRR